jgi:chloride channel protein, CIC family
VARAGARVKSLPYVPKWLVLGAMLGVIAGLGTVLFYEALRLATHFFLEFLAGYHQPNPAGEGGGTGDAGYARPWAIPLVVVLGALLAGFVVFTWAPEAEGHGTDAAIDAFHKNPHGIQVRVVIVKIVASALTIGSGGAGGREGPTAQISAGFGSLLARVLHLSAEDGRIAIAVGVGSGIGAMFGAPLGGAVLAADVVYRDDFEAEALLPGLFSSVVAWAIFGAFFGYRPLFTIPSYHFTNPVQLAWFAVLGIVCGFLGLLYSKSFYGLTALSRRLRFTKKLRPAAGAACVGLIALALPQVLGTGAGWIQEGLSGRLDNLPLIIVIALPFARILATSLSIGTGGSGGVFGPGLVIGAFTGLAVWRLLLPIVTGVGTDPAPFIVIGMMALFGAIARAPVANMLLVAQMTGNISLLGPAMIAVAIATFIVHLFDDSIFRSQLRNRAASTAGRLTSGPPRPAAVPVSTAAVPSRIVLRAADGITEALTALRAVGVTGAPVTDGNGIYLGTVSASRLAQAAGGDGGDGRADGRADVGSVADPTSGTVPAGAQLSTGIDALVQAGGQWVTVTDDKRRVTGILSAGDVGRSYRHALKTPAAMMAGASPSAVVVEDRVGPGSPLVATALRDAGLPAGCIVVNLCRGTWQVPVAGETILEAGDQITALAPPAAIAAFRAMISTAKPA